MIPSNAGQSPCLALSLWVAVVATPFLSALACSRGDPDTPDDDGAGSGASDLDASADGEAEAPDEGNENDNDNGDDNDNDNDNGDDNDNDNDNGDDNGDDEADDGNTGEDDTDADPDKGFEPLSARAAVAKVKSLLTGLPPTDEEVAAVESNHAALPDLIDSWMTLPAFDRRLQWFFQHHFQQQPVPVTDFNLQTGSVTAAWQPPADTLLLRGLTDSFARTAVDLVHNGRPFSELLSTRRYYMSTAMMMLYAYIDGKGLADDTDQPQAQAWLKNEYADLVMTYFDAGQQQIPLTESLDPQSVNFMTFSLEHTDPPTQACLDTLGVPRLQDFARLMFTFGGRRFPDCPTLLTRWLEEEDFKLRPVTIVQAQDGEAKTVFWDLFSLREADTIVLAGEHVGFFTTPVYFANWSTNIDNSFRVTANQALIVALGHNLQAESEFFNPAEIAGAFAGDDDHADPQSSCYNCHVILDPLRNFYRQSFTTLYAPRMEQIFNGEPIPEESSFYLGARQWKVLGRDHAAILTG
ncbi:MAG: hypothetical protein V3V08_24750 [Nannocystaceae bacterium]